MQNRDEIILLKQKFRQRLKSLRNGLANDLRARCSQAILDSLEELPEFLTAQRIFSYISNGSEVDTHALIRSRIENTTTLAVPKIMDKTTMIAVRFSKWEDMVADSMGIMTPVSNETSPDPYDVVITPALGFNRDGFRMGYGRGYYDRWFSNHQVKTKIALCYSVQLMDELPHDKYDIPVDIIVTEKEIIRINKA